MGKARLGSPCPFEELVFAQGIDEFFYLERRYVDSIQHGATGQGISDREKSHAHDNEGWMNGESEPASMVNRL